MNKKIHIISALTLALVFAVAFSAAADRRDHDREISGEAPAAVSNASPTPEQSWLETAVAAYPMRNCVVSDEELDAGAMGEPINHVYQVAEKPDRLVRFCCKSCVKDFKKDPAMYLAIIDAAAEGGESEEVGAASADHSRHNH